jgi:hypothetical protein
MSDIKMPQRWFRVSTGWVKDCAGEWVKAEDAEPLVAEIKRLRARVEVLERIRAAADDLFAYDSGWSHWEQKYRALRAALKEAKP